MGSEHAIHAVAFLQDLATVMIVAGAVTILFHRLRQPVVLGYIIAGLIIGPHTPPFPLVAQQETIHTLAELGIVFLMFSLGLEFSLRKLRQVGATAFIAALMEIIVMFGAGYGIGQAFAWSAMDSVFLGALLAMSSTTIIVKALSELGKMKQTFAHLIFGILIVEDLLGILLIALLSGIATTGTLDAVQVFEATGRLSAFLVVVLVLGLLFVPRLLRWVAGFHRDEMLLVTVLGLCFGGSLLAVQLGYSVALGAFAIGAVIAESRELGRIEQLTAPIRDMFAAVFFVAIGLLIDPRLLVEYALPIAVITFAVLVGKVLTCALGTFLAGHDVRTALLVGMGLSQIGEFSFIIAALGETLGVTSAFLYPVTVAVSAVTTLSTPYMIRWAEVVAARFERSAPPTMLRSLDLYRDWVAALGHALERSVARRLVWRMLSVIAVNMLLVVAAFIGARFLADRLPHWVDAPWLEGRSGVVWFGVLLLTLPLYVATLRKLRALAMFVAELTIGRRAVGTEAATGETLLRHAIMAVGVLVLAVATAVLSAPLLPRMPIVLGMLAALTAVAALLWRPSIALYSRAQISLRDVLDRPPTAHPPEPPPALRSFLREAQVELVPIVDGAPAAGRLIREIELRSRTGASVVGIERGDGTVVNPGPDEELQVGDNVLLLGSAAQRAAAFALLTGRGRDGASGLSPG